MRGGEVYDVFLNYSRADSAAAEDLRARLMEAGLTAFVDRYALPASQPWQPWLEQHLKFCRALAALVGSEGLGEWQHREIQLGLDRQASAATAGQAFPVIPVLLPGLASDAIPIGSFLSLNTWVDLRSGLDDPESLQSPISGAQGAAIDAAAAEKLLAGLTPCRSASRTRACSSAASASSTSWSRRSSGARRPTSLRSSAGRAAANHRSSTLASSPRCVASGASATSSYGGFLTCVPMTSRSINWRPPSMRQRRSRARWRGSRGVISPYGAGRRPYLIYVQSDFLPGRDLWRLAAISACTSSWFSLGLVRQPFCA